MRVGQECPRLPVLLCRSFVIVRVTANCFMNFDVCRVRIPRVGSGPVRSYHVLVVGSTGRFQLYM